LHAEAPVVVIGYGNNLRGDDGVGRYAAQGLALRLPLQMATVLDAHQLLPEMAQVVSAAQLVVLIDAAVGSPAGAIQQQVITPSDAMDTAVGLVGHHLDPARLLAAARRLYGRCPETLLFTVYSHSFDFGEALSIPVQAALPGLLDQVEQVIRSRFPPA
jgi:hydrogenase maturation protease